MTTTSRSSVAAAHDHVQACEKQAEDAQDQLVQAQDQLDGALAARGWTRLPGLFNPGSTPIYQNVMYPGSTVAQPEVLKACIAQDGHLR